MSILKYQLALKKFEPCLFKFGYVRVDEASYPESGNRKERFEANYVNEEKNLLLTMTYTYFVAEKSGISLNMYMHHKLQKDAFFMFLTFVDVHFLSKVIKSDFFGDDPTEFFEQYFTKFEQISNYELKPQLIGEYFENHTGYIRDQKKKN